MNHKLVVGMVGRVGSGKSTVARILSSKYGFHHMDVDRFGHTALTAEIKALIMEFGPEIISDGKIDRKKLGSIVFQDTEKLLKLNSIVHPRIKQMAGEEISRNFNKNIILDAALLYEIGLDEFCDFIITVEAPEEQMIQRVQKYRGWSLEQAESVMKSQEYLRFLGEKTDFILFNNGTELKLEKQIEFLVHVIC